MRAKPPTIFRPETCQAGAGKRVGLATHRRWGLVTTAGRRRWHLAALITAVTVAAPLIDQPAGVSAGPIDDQRDRVAVITDQLEALEEQADVLAEQLVIATDEYETLVADIDAAEAAVQSKQAEVDQVSTDLGDIAVQAYLSAGTEGLALFSSSTEIVDDAQRTEYLSVAVGANTTTADDLGRVQRELEAQHAELEHRRAAAAAQRERVEQAQATTEAQTAEYQQARAEAEAELGELIAQEEERRARESYERIQREAAAAAARQQTRQQEAAQAQAAAATARPTINPAAPAVSSTPAPTASPTPSPNLLAAASVPATSSQAGTAVSAALSQQGVPWVFGKAEPGVAFDCSGLTSWSWGRAGVYLPHQSAQQFATLPHVPASAAQPGDLIFFYTPISHVGMYIGGGMMVHSPNSGSVVHIRAVNWDRVVGVARPG